ncbi:Myb-related transcription factor, partner of profilin [Varanus komodoensis]|nr:Myb-related transcription factor, partner of profilin [Varanus komodoensis]
MAGRRGMLKRKPNFTLQEIDILMREVLNKINAAGRNQRDIGEVKNRWRGLRRRANDKIARHRLQQRRALPLAERLHLTRLPGPGGSSKPSARPELSPEWSLVHGACPSDPPPLPGALEAAAAAQGVKEEPFHPLHTETIQQCVSRGAKRQPLRSSGHAPDDPCEGWSRSPLNFSQTELSISELGGQQEVLGLDYASITFDQESPHGQLNGCNVGDVIAPGTVLIQEGPSEHSRFSLAQRRIVQSNEELVQELHAFRQEYTASCRETASILHSIAETLSGVHNSLSEIRDLCICQQAVPKQ